MELLSTYVINAWSNQPVEGRVSLAYLSKSQSIIREANQGKNLVEEPKADNGGMLLIDYSPWLTYFAFLYYPIQLAQGQYHQWTGLSRTN